MFTQLNIPVVGEANSLPLVQQLDFEASWRHDQYSDVGGTSNPKLGFNWTVSRDAGLFVRGLGHLLPRAKFRRTIRYRGKCHLRHKYS